MSVIVDREELQIKELGLETIGQVLSHLQRTDRLIVNLLIDGNQPNLAGMHSIRQSPTAGRIVYIETVRPREMALEVLDAARIQLSDAEQSKVDAAELFQQNQIPPAMEKLAAYFTAWQSAHESVVKLSELLKIDLEALSVAGESVTKVLGEFTAQLREIKQTLLNRDYVILTDVLLYETAETYDRWTAVLESIRDVAATGLVAEGASPVCGITPRGSCAS